MKLYFDESGYTGEDLINKVQPVFVLASTILDDSEAHAISKDIFKGVQAPELKHSTLRKTASGQKRVLDFLQALKQFPNKAGTNISHKLYELVCMLVEWWVEPYAYQDGIDLYDRGANIGLSNLIYVTLLSVEGEAFLQKHLGNFQEMMRNRTPESFTIFCQALRHDYDRSDKLVQDVLLWPVEGCMRLGHKHLLGLPDHILDISMTTAASTVNYWRQKTDSQFEVIHDKSSAMAKDQWLWDQLVNPAIEPAIVGYDRRKWHFPLGVLSTSFEDSAKSLQIQLTDILAGSTAEWCASRADENRKSDYTEALKEAGIAGFVIGGGWPSTDVTPEELGTDTENAGNPLDLISPKIKLPKQP